MYVSFIFIRIIYAKMFFYSKKLNEKKKKIFYCTAAIAKRKI